MKTRWLRLLGWMLSNANAHVQEGFYPLKDKILSWHGTHTGDVIQHIKKVCYSCDGTGIYEYGPPAYREAPCRSCGATGIYSEFWVLLECWSLGNRSFHRPFRKFWKNEPIPIPYLQDLWPRIVAAKQRDVIEGYIKHDRPRHGLGVECYLCLALLFDRKLFRRRFGRYQTVERPRYPLAAVSWLIRKMAEWWENFRFVQKCPACGGEKMVLGWGEFGEHEKNCWLVSDELPF